MEDYEKIHMKRYKILKRLKEKDYEKIYKRKKD